MLNIFNINIAIYLGNLLVSVALAYLLAFFVTYSFIKLGKSFSISERLFPRISARQEIFFGGFGFYFLSLLAIEILNPRSLKSFVEEIHIFHPPSFLGEDIFFHGFAFQEFLSVILLAIILGAVYARLKAQHSNFPFKLAKPNTFSRDLNERHLTKEFKVHSREMSFALNLSATSLLIALISPLFISSFIENLGFIAVTGVVLLSGVHCFIEGIKLGSWATQNVKEFSRVKDLIFSTIFWPGLGWYLAIAVVGFFIYTFIPLVVGVEEIPGLIRVISKVTAGVSVFIAAFLIVWGRSGFTERLNVFLLSIALAPLIFPVSAIAWSGFSFLLNFIFDIPRDSVSPLFEVVYALICLASPLIFYVIASNRILNRIFKRNSTPSLGFLRNISWVPFTIAGVREHFKCDGYSNAEDLLQIVIGNSTRLNKRSQFARKIRNYVGNLIGFYKEYDFLILDISSYLRLTDGMILQGREPYQVIAGICLAKDNLIYAGSSTHPDQRVLIEGPSDLTQNAGMHKLYEEAFRKLASFSKDGGVHYFPSNRIGDFYPEIYESIMLSEPFSTAVKWKNRDKKLKFVNIRPNSPMSVLASKYYVLLAHSSSDTRHIRLLISILLKGRSYIEESKKRGKGLINNNETIVEDLDPGPSHFITMRDIELALNRVAFSSSGVIYPANLIDKNWGIVTENFDLLFQNSIISIKSSEDLKEYMNCSYMLYQDIDSQDADKIST